MKGGEVCEERIGEGGGGRDGEMKERRSGGGGG